MPRPKLANSEGSILWGAIWKQWLEIRETLHWTHPTDREEVASCRLQGIPQVWKTGVSQQLDCSQRLNNAAQNGLVTIGDLWCWGHERWKTAEELRQTFGVPPSLASLLSEIVPHKLAPEVLAAWSKEVEIKKGMWVTDASIFEHSLPAASRQAVYVERMAHHGVEGQLFSIKDDLGTLHNEGPVCWNNLEELTPIIVLYQRPKGKWQTDSKWKGHPNEFSGRIVWHEVAARSQVSLNLSLWMDLAGKEMGLGGDCYLVQPGE